MSHLCRASSALAPLRAWVAAATRTPALGALPRPRNAQLRLYAKAAAPESGAAAKKGRAKSRAEGSEDAAVDEAPKKRGRPPKAAKAAEQEDGTAEDASLAPENDTASGAAKKSKRTKGGKAGDAESGDEGGNLADESDSKPPKSYTWWKEDFARRLKIGLSQAPPAKLPVDAEYLRMRKLVSSDPKKKSDRKAAKLPGMKEAHDPVERTEAFLSALAESQRSRGDPDAVKLAWNSFRDLQQCGEIHVTISASRSKEDGAVSDEGEDPLTHRLALDSFRVPTDRLLELMDLLRQEKMEAECEHVLAAVRSRWAQFSPRTEDESAHRRSMLDRAYDLALDCAVRRAWSQLLPGTRKSKPHPNLASAHERVLKVLRQIKMTPAVVPSANAYNAVLRLHMLADPVQAEHVARRMLTQAVAVPLESDIRQFDPVAKPIKRQYGIPWNIGTYGIFLDGYHRLGDQASFAKWADSLEVEAAKRKLVAGEPDTLSGDALGRVLSLLFTNGRESLARNLLGQVDMITEPVLSGAVMGLSHVGKWHEAREMVLAAEAEYARGEQPNNDFRRVPGLFTYTHLIDALYRAGELELAGELFDRVVSREGLDLRPNPFLLAVVARAYSKMDTADAPERAVDLIASVREVHGVQPGLTSMAPLLDRALALGPDWKRAASLIDRARESWGLRPEGRMIAKIAVKAVASGEGEGAQQWVSLLSLPEADMEPVKRALEGVQGQNSGAEDVAIAAPQANEGAQDPVEEKR